MKKRTFSLSEKQITELQHAAKVSGLKISEHVRRAIDADLAEKWVWSRRARR
jgi:hypothetical protein